MRAINLIPADERRGGGGGPGRSGGGVYVVLGALALVVVVVAASMLANKSVSDKQSELARVTHEADTAEARANQFTDYTQFASLRERREQTVKQLVASRFDWAHALHEVARVLPRNSWLTQLTASTSPGATTAGGDPLRSAMAVPALEIQGCTTSQASVARVMAQLRLIDGVQQVSLSSSDKGAKKVGMTAVSSGSSGSTGGGDCRGDSNHFPQFSVVVFYEPTPVVPSSTTPGTTQTAAAVSPAGAASSTAPAGTSPAASTTTPASAGGTTP
jgi:Tfp pilus assembly protein PilN